MGKEIERKFLLGESFKKPLNYETAKIKQAYISVENGKQTRVRIIYRPKTKTYESTIGIKYTDNIVRDEYEIPIETKIAKEIFNKCKLSLEKKRLSFVIGNEHYDIDTFPNGIVFAEVEYKSLDSMNKWVKPSWLGKEITKDKKFSNITLAKKNLKF